MDWNEIKERSKQLQEEGKTEQEAVELLRDEIVNFAKDCMEHPEKMADVMPDIGKIIQDNPVAADFFFFLFFRTSGGWGM